MTTLDRYLYFDTNIFSLLVSDEKSWPKMREFLKKKNLTLGVAGAALSELHDAFSLHEKLIDLFWHLPTKFIRTWDEVLSLRLQTNNLFGDINISLHERYIGDFPLNEKENHLSGLRQILKSARDGQRKDAKELSLSIVRWKDEFPPLSDGNYHKSQMKDFVMKRTNKYLEGQDKDYLLLYKKYGPKIDHFEAVETFSHFVFLKYFIASQKVRQLSDFGDLFHVFYMPFVDIAILERNMSHYLRVIQKHYGIIQNVEIHNIDFYNEIINGK